MEKLTILHCIPSLSGGGAERQLSYLAPELSGMGNDVHIAYIDSGPDKPDLKGVFLHKLKAGSNYDLSLLWQLIKLIRDIKPDIVQTWLLQMDILSGIAARINNIPWIFREPSSAFAYSSSWKYRLRKKICSMANAVVSNSKAGQDYWAEQLPEMRSYMIANGLDLTEINNADAELSLDIINMDQPIVVYVGRLTSDNSASKNLEHLLKAFSFVIKKKKILGVLCGEGPQRSALEHLMNKLGLDNCVRFTGYLPSENVWTLMKKASLFISLSAYEGCPNSVMEGAACGCSLVLSDIDGHHQIIENNDAFFVDPKDPQKVANAIVEALDNSQLSKERSSRVKLKAKSWSVKRMAQQYEKVYEEVLSI